MKVKDSADRIAWVYAKGLSCDRMIPLTLILLINKVGPGKHPVKMPPPIKFADMPALK